MKKRMEIRLGQSRVDVEASGCTHCGRGVDTLTFTYHEQRTSSFSVTHPPQTLTGVVADAVHAELSSRAGGVR